MRKQRGSIVEPISDTNIAKTLFGGIASLFTMKAHAEEGAEEEGDTGSEEGDQTETKKTVINYEDLIAKARREEKEKQYKKIEKLNTQVNTLTTQHNEDLVKIATLEASLKDAEKKLSTSGEGDSEAVKTLKNEVSTLTKDKVELEKKVATLEGQTPVSREEIEAEVRAELEAEYEVKTYKAEKLAELKDEILVPELIIGNTKEELDVAFQVALERSKEIRESLGVKDNKKTEKRTPKTPSNPSMSGVQDNSISLEYLASLNPGSKEYADLRKQLGLVR